MELIITYDIELSDEQKEEMKENLNHWEAQLNDKFLKDKFSIPGQIRLHIDTIINDKDGLINLPESLIPEIELKLSDLLMNDD